jgi:hypothetical protein
MKKIINKKLPHRNVSCTSKYCESIDAIVRGHIGFAPMTIGFKPVL